MECTGPTQIARSPLSVSDIGSGMGAILVIQLMPLDRILDSEISELVLDLFFNGMTSLLGDQLSYTHACLEIISYTHACLEQHKFVMYFQVLLMQ